MIYKVLFLSAIWCLFIQQPFNKSEQSKGSYFDSIYSAEEFIICQDYKSALKIYSDLFENYDSPRVFDYYNAALCAVYCNNNKSFLIFVQQCIEKGFRFDFIESILKDKLGLS
ncbi:MAG: hypothetical protein JEY96_08865 [Bacteroidales bacterium]|nr:hypothetical protein [Bacteroidales bacterium]